MDSPSLYRDTLKRSWYTTKKYKHLWVLGFFAALLGNGGEFEFILTQFNKLSSGTITFSQSILTTLGTGGSNIIQFIAGLLSKSSEDYIMLGVLSVVLLVVVWMVVSSQGALMRAVAASGQGTLRQHFSAGSSSFWHLIAVFISTRLGAFFLLSVVGVPVFVLLMYWVDPIKALFLVVFVLGIPLFIVASLISKYAIAYRMLENKNWKSSLKSALSLFFDHWLVSIELALILFFINIIAGAVIIIIVLIFAVPFILLSYVFGSSIVGSAVLMTVGQVFAFLLLILLGSILATFQYSAWVELFLKIRKHKYISKVVRTLTLLHERYR